MTKLTPISRFTVDGYSMQPTLTNGQDILSFNWAFLGRKPKIGEVIVLNYQGMDLVKRVVKVQGEEIFVEGDNKQSLRLPDGSLKNESTDSRDFGPINLNQIVGKVVYQSSTPRHPELVSGSNSEIPKQVRNDEFDYNEIPCPKCNCPVIGIYGRKDALCQNCGFKLSCCGEP